MEDITITNQNGESICLGRRGPFFLEKIEGLGEVEVGIESQKAPYQDGSTYIDNTLENRALSMEGTIIAKGNPEALPAARRKLQRVLNPKLGEVVIIYRQGEKVKKITGMAESTPVFPGGKGRRGHYYQKFLLHLICHQPFWLDQFTESREIVTWNGDPAAKDYRQASPLDHHLFVPLATRALAQFPVKDDAYLPFVDYKPSFLQRICRLFMGVYINLKFPRLMPAPSPKKALVIVYFPYKVKLCVDNPDRHLLHHLEP